MDGFTTNPYPKSKFNELINIESKSWWFRAREEIILWVILNIIKPSKHTQYLEVGCGTGYMLKGVNNAFPELNISGSEYYAEGVTFAQARNPNLRIFRLDICTREFDSKYDIIAAYDVIEHIKDDQAALKNIFNHLNPGGTLILTVPQHKWLWSNIDVLAYHQRRYSKKQLFRQLEECGFAVKYHNAFMALVLPIMMASRAIKQSRGSNSNELNPPLFISFILSAICKIELLAIKLGAHLPLGGSLMIVSTKQ